MNENTLPSTEQDYSNCNRYIQAQARLAFSKINRNSGLELEDFVSIGYEILENAKKNWNPEKKTKFNSYFTMLLQSRFYKEMSKTHRKKRGGAGNKKEDIRFGRGERWTNGEANKETAVHVSIETSSEDKNDNGTSFIQVVAPDSNVAEYDFLVGQIQSKIPNYLQKVFKQMIDPDDELLSLAYEKYKDKNECKIDDRLMASYLNMDLLQLRSFKQRIKILVAKYMEIGIKV